MKTPLLTVLLITTSSAAYASPTGFWHCTSDAGQSPLVILKSGVLSLDGAPARYRDAKSALEVMQNGTWVSYPYRLKGDSMTVTMPNKSKASCKRINSGQDHQLRGPMCSWSGSSNTYSGTSSSSTRRVLFDGRGGFTTNFESSYSANTGDGYHNRGATNGGFYRVAGDHVIVVMSNGQGGVAKVHMRQNNGRITELKYNGQLFATGLCG